METLWVCYYVFLALALGAAIGYYFFVSVANNPGSQEHFIGVNMTKDNGICRVTWLGGWDFDSFYTNVTVNGVNVGHPSPMTVIYNGVCKNITVMMHDKAVHSDIELYHYTHNGAIK
jgi:hypothetical protein